MTSASPEYMRRVAEEPGALPALVAAVAAGRARRGPNLKSAAKCCAVVLARIIQAIPGFARRVAEEPGALPALVAAVAAGGGAAAAELQGTALISVGVMALITEASPDYAQRVAEEPGALSTLIAAVAYGGAAAASAAQRIGAGCSAMVLGDVARASPGLARRVSQGPGALRALVNAMAGGGSTAIVCAEALRFIAEADPALAQRVATHQIPDTRHIRSIAGASGSCAGRWRRGSSWAAVLGTIAAAQPRLALHLAEEPRALPALLAAVAGGEDAARGCSKVLITMAAADPALAQRVVEAPGVLPALVAAAAAGRAEAASASQQETAAHSELLLATIALATPRLAQRVAGAAGALPALVNAMAGGGSTATVCAEALQRMEPQPTQHSRSAGPKRRGASAGQCHGSRRRCGRDSRAHRAWLRSDLGRVQR